MIAAPLMKKLQESTYAHDRRKGRNENMVWFLTSLLKWFVVQVPTEVIGRAGGATYAPTDRVSLDVVFEANDRGLKTMKDWCDGQCSKNWRYEPAGTFMFSSQKDAALFKLRWF